MGKRFYFMQLCFKISEQKNRPICKFFGAIQFEIQWENVWVLYNFALKRMVCSEIDPKKCDLTKNFLKTYFQMF
jgi:hypothetical protein